MVRMRRKNIPITGFSIFIVISLLLHSYNCRRTSDHDTQLLTRNSCESVFEETISLGIKVNSLPQSIPYTSVSWSVPPKHATNGQSLSDQLRALRAHSFCTSMGSDGKNLELPQTCCTGELELALLHKTTDELQESLSTYLARWASDVASLRSELKSEFFHCLEVFRVELAKCLCGLINDTATAEPCTHMASDMVPKFRIMLEQLLVGQADATMDISIPVDNLIIQLLIDASCQTKSSASGNTVEDFNEEIRCHTYCQARLTVILDALLNESEQIGIATKTQLADHVPRTLTEAAAGAHSDEHHNGLDPHRLLYTADLLFTIRLNRLLKQAFDLAESLLEGLKEFNAAQGICALKFMRMHRCALCAGEILTRPCPELCFTILSSCYKPLTELQESWRRFTESIKSVIETLLKKPHLSLITQCKQLPRRLISYFRHLLKSHFNWLQPQCSGTVKLLDLLQRSKSMEEDGDTSCSTDSNEWQSYNKLLMKIQFKMDQMKNVWTQISSSLCTESPYLVPNTGDLDDCWNGTARGRFHLHQCDFCESRKAASGESAKKFTEVTERSDDILAVDRHHSTSHRTPELSLFESRLRAISEDFYFPQLLESQHEREMATSRANEILVRAAGDLQWSTELLIGEVEAYTTVHQRLSETRSVERRKKGEPLPTERTESWVQIPANVIDKEANSLAPNLDSSLGVLAYGSMLGWNAPDLGPRTQTLGNTESTLRMSLNEKLKGSENSTKIDRPQSVGMSSTKNAGQRNANEEEEEEEENSGFPLNWSLYQWPHGDLTQAAEVGGPEKPTSKKPTNHDKNKPDFESSGSASSQDSTSSFMQYADYPSLSTFHSFLSPEHSLSINHNTEFEITGAPEDDEDYRINPETDLNGLTDESKQLNSVKATLMHSPSNDTKKSNSDNKKPGIEVKMAKEPGSLGPRKSLAISPTGGYHICFIVPLTQLFNLIY